jgi:hypothetical protein
MNRISAKLITALFILFLLVGIFSCKKKEGIEPKPKVNFPPEVISVFILPDKPTKGDNLNLTIQSRDPDGDPITYHYEWLKNDQEMIGENKNVLRSGNFKKGDLIKVKVIPSDGKEDGKPFLSDPVKIFNSPPIIREVWIEPKVASARDNLKVYLKSFDADGDFIYYTYIWEKNGVVMAEEKAETLARNRFKKGDSITVTVTPDDRETLGLPKKSNAINISNSPPIITSTPPTSTEGKKYGYQVNADDPDNDPITFTLKSGPKGMEIGENTGFVRWDMKEEDKGTYLIEIEASDSEGAKSLQQYKLTVEFRKP